VGRLCLQYWLGSSRKRCLPIPRSTAGTSQESDTRGLPLSHGNLSPECERETCSESVTKKREAKCAYLHVVTISELSLPSSAESRIYGDRKRNKCVPTVRGKSIVWKRSMSPPEHGEQSDVGLKPWSRKKLPSCDSMGAFIGLFESNLRKRCYSVE
jgi:hypothetical protein